MYYRRPNNKYGNHKLTIDGETFDSKKEYSRFYELNLMRKAGEIRNLERQTEFELQPAFVDRNGHKVRPILYMADFTYFDKDGVYHIEDVKSKATRENRAYMLKKKMMAYHGWYIEEV